MPTEILIIAALIVANGLFAGAEIAILSVREVQLKAAVAAGDRRARTVTSLREVPDVVRRLDAS